MARLRSNHYKGMWVPLIPIILRLHKNGLWPAEIRRTLLEMEKEDTLPHVHCLENYSKVPSRTVTTYMILKEGLIPNMHPNYSGGRNLERNEDICEENKDPSTTHKILAKKYGISSPRVGQIIRKGEHRNMEKSIRKLQDPYSVEGIQDQRIRNCLNNNNIRNLRVLREFKEEELLRMDNFGRASLLRLIAHCDKIGIYLKEDWK